MRYRQAQKLQAQSRRLPASIIGKTPKYKVSSAGNFEANCLSYDIMFAIDGERSTFVPLHRLYDLANSAPSPPCTRCGTSRRRKTWA
jgi:hypothetical protein